MHIINDLNNKITRQRGRFSQLVKRLKKISKDNKIKEDRKSNYATLFFIGAQIYSYNDITHPCCMPSPLTTTSHQLISILEAPTIT